MRQMQAAGSFTRGWESLTHFLVMFRASLLRQTSIVLLLSAVWSGHSLLSEMGPARRHLPTYVLVHWLGDILPHKTVTLGSWRGTYRYAEPVLTQAFGDRPLPFIARQWAMRTALRAVPMMVVLAILMVWLGRVLVRDRHRRGARVVDTTRWTYRHRGTLVRLLVASLIGVAGGGIMVARQDGGLEALVVLPDVGLLHLYRSSHTMAQWLSPAFDGARIWHTATEPHALMPIGEHVGVLAGLSVRCPWQLLLRLFAMGTSGAFLISWLGCRYLWPKHQEGCLTFVGHPLEHTAEVGHIAVVGGTGAGKSVAIKDLLDQIRARGQRAIVFDTKLEYVENYFRPGHDILLNPKDARSVCWSPWAEVRDRGDYYKLGCSLFPEDMSREKFWPAAGASLFAAITRRMLERGQAHNQQLAHQLLHASLEDLQKSLEHTGVDRYMDKSNMSSSLLATLGVHLQAFNTLRNIGEDETAFSIRDFVEEPQDDRWLFITMRAEDEKEIRPLVSMWYDIAINAVLALPEEPPNTPEPQKRRIFAVLDELARLQKLPALDAAIREGRSKGLGIILGFQSIASLKDRGSYGPDLAEAILGQPQTFLALRAKDTTSATWIERVLGMAEVERATESEQMGASVQRDGVSVQRHIAKQSVVLYSEITDLPPLTGYLKTVGRPAMKVRYRWKDRDPSLRQPGFVAVAEEPEPIAPPWAQAEQCWQRHLKATAREEPIEAFVAAAEALPLLDPQDRDDVHRVHKALRELEHTVVKVVSVHLRRVVEHDRISAVLDAEHFAAICSTKEKQQRWERLGGFLQQLGLPTRSEQADTEAPAASLAASTLLGELQQVHMRTGSRDGAAA